MNDSSVHFFVYIVRCSDNSLYTGMTQNVEKRLRMHNGEIPGGARYTRSRRPVRLVYRETVESHRDAMHRERQIKKFSKKKKEFLAQQWHKNKQ